MPLESSLRQHRNRAVGKVDRGSAQARFQIERGSGPNVVADVGDVDLQLPVAVRERLDADGVIEVACGLAVDGDDRQAAEVAAFCQLLRCEAIDCLLC